MSELGSIWQDLFGLFVLFAFGLWLYVQVSGKKWKDVFEQIKELWR